jgi:hypothetical protein
MKRLRIILKAGAVFDVDISEDWNLEPDLVKFQPPPGEWTERLRYIQGDGIAAIIEVRASPGE